MASLAATAGLIGCSSDDRPDVRVAQVGRATVTEVVEAPATVVAKASATVTSPADGRVARLRVKHGQQVQAGQVLLRIESPDARRRLRQARQADAQAAAAGNVSLPGADLSGAQARADQAAGRAFTAARAAAQRIPDRGLRRQALARVAEAEAEYTAARAAAAQAVARFNAGLGSVAEALSSLAQLQRAQTQAALAVARRTVAALTVRAPISGTVALGGAAAGGAGGGAAPGGGGLSGLLDSLPQEAQGQASELLGGSSGAAGVHGPVVENGPVAAGATLATITDVSELSLTAEVDETDVLLVAKGVRADVELDAVPGATYAARVRSVDLSPTTSTRGGVTYVVRLSLGGGTTVDGDPAPTPRPGMSAVADLRVRTARDAVAVPAAAIVRDGPRDAVFVADNGVARRRTVRLGAQGDAMVQVLDGVQVGERIVVSGADQLSDGQELP